MKSVTCWAYPILWIISSSPAPPMTTPIYQLQAAICQISGRPTRRFPCCTTLMVSTIGVPRSKRHSSPRTPRGATSKFAMVPPLKLHPEPRQEGQIPTHDAHATSNETRCATMQTVRGSTPRNSEGLKSTIPGRVSNAHFRGTWVNRT